MNKFKKIFMSFLGVTLISLYFFGCNVTNDEPSKDVFVENTDTTISIVACGDVLMHMEQVYSGYDASTKEYNFSDFFTYVKDYISNSDLALCNIETTFLENSNSYTGYPKFNSPKEILNNLHQSGFDYACSAHNHINDMGNKGIIDTAKIINNSPLKLLGIRSSDNDKNYSLIDINGIKVGLTNYTYGTRDRNGYRYINGLPVSKNLENRINLFSFDNIEEDIKQMEETKNKMQEDGAEFIIFYIHWGNEYQTLPSVHQEKLAKKLNEIGVDVIFGSHPHVVQPIRTIKNNETNKETLVFYSLGNFISNQSFDTIGNAKSEDGLMVKITITKNEKNEVKLTAYETEPTWVYKHKNSNGKTVYNIIPTETVLNNIEDYNFSQDVINKIKISQESTTEIMNN